MAASECHLTKVLRLRSVLLLFILPVCNFLPWLLVDGFVGTAAIGMQSYEADFPTLKVESNSPFSLLNMAVLPVPPEPMDPICQVLINNFTESSILYTRCIIQNAKTYKRCQRCIDEYLEVDKGYRLLRQEQKNSTLKRCTEIYPGMEEVNVFSNVFNFVQDSWKAGGCQNCFSWFYIDSSNAGELTKAAKTFLNLSELFLSCIFNESIVYRLQEHEPSNLLLLNHLRNDSNMTVCNRCKGAYKKLNDFYVSKFETLFDKDAIICMDISDLMNFTRYMWQELYKCPIQHASVWPVVVASVVMCSVPVGFYIATKVFGHDVERKMVHQKRLRRRSGGSSATRISTSSDFGNNLSM